ncbi:TetR family transcriptional regulator [Bosea caraganae]|uniref:TetR family transcriptional regulator n=1 Tax=Bosea caraganae TaxID=2763117 RepID=A0A370L8B2_9HYPH|nr:TetR family transcriptional regulator [Bosea caraganae]RDJ25166.1 TetR family transcriptional regulator [Bosea caraganae]RDJ26276.1 TetR family transcriptional regulator [Bosea caraganae]
MRVPEDTIKANEGLRERKRRQTRERIADAAKTLFLERGFDATTIEEIAAAADVSKRTFFDYFPSKEDVISAWQDRFGEVMAEAVLARPPGESLIKVVEEALIGSVLVSAADPQALALGKLIRETPALRGREQLKYVKLEQKLAEALAARTPDEANRLRTRLLAMIVVGGMRVGGECWHEDGVPEDVEGFARDIFAAIWSELAAFGRLGGEC